MSDFEFSNAAETKTRRGTSSMQPKRNPTSLTTGQPETKPEARIEVPAAAQAPVEIPAQGAGEENDKKPNKPKYDKEELARIFDEIIFSGEYSEEVTLRGKLHVRFRTRTTEEIEQISMVIDSTKATLMATLAEKRSILNLQYALQAYGGKDLRSMSVEDRAKFVKRLPGPVVGALLTSLNDFDAKVYEACLDGEENF